MTQIVIEIRGGVLTTVISNTEDFEYILVDHDNLNIEPEDFDLSATGADYVVPDIAEFLKAGENTNKRTKRLAEIVKREFNH